MLKPSGKKLSILPPKSISEDLQMRPMLSSKPQSVHPGSSMVAKQPDTSESLGNSLISQECPESELTHKYAIEPSSVAVLSESSLSTPMSTSPSQSNSVKISPQISDQEASETQGKISPPLQAITTFPECKESSHSRAQSTNQSLGVTASSRNEKDSKSVSKAPPLHIEETMFSSPFTNPQNENLIPKSPVFLSTEQAKINTSLPKLRVMESPPPFSPLSSSPNDRDSTSPPPTPSNKAQPDAPPTQPSARKGVPIPPPIIDKKLSFRGGSLPTQTPKISLKPLYWVRLARAISGTFWAEVKEYGDANGKLNINMSELQSLFFTQVSTSETENKSKTRRAKVERVHLVDIKRANNCEIMLTNLKMPLADLPSAVMSLDDSNLDADKVEILLKICPTKEEMSLLEGYTGDKANLGKCEQFFLEMMKLPRVESKLTVFLFKIQFSSKAADVRSNLTILKNAYREVRESIKLRKLMHAILSLGNALNQGTARGSAVGFKLDILLKLIDTRSHNRKISLMHYLCKVLADELPDVLDANEGLPHLEASTKILLKTMAEEMNDIKKGLANVHQELATTQDESLVSEGVLKKLKDFHQYAEATARSLTYLFEEVGRNLDAFVIYFGEDPKRCPYEQVATTLVTFMKMFKRAHNENCKQAELERMKAEKEAQKVEKLEMTLEGKGDI